MKRIYKVLLLVIVIGIFLSACTPPPPPVEKNQLNEARMDAEKAQTELETLTSERDDLKNELSHKQKELKELKIYQAEMKNIISILLLVTFAFSFLSAEVIYKSEEEYKQLKKNERLDYWNDLTTEMTELQKNKADAIAGSEKVKLVIKEEQKIVIPKVKLEIKNLNTELEKTNNEYDKVYNEILENLGVSKGELKFVEQKIKLFNSKIENWKSLSDDELWSANKSIKEFVEEYNTYRVSNQAKAPDFRKDFSDLDRKVLSLQDDVESAKPRYFEDEYTVKNGDSLSKISGYEYIYNDPSKWELFIELTAIR